MSRDSQGTSVTQDGLSMLFGQEHGGRVRGLGFGVVPSQLRIRSNSKSGEVHALRNQVSGLETKVQELTSMLLVRCRFSIYKAVRLTIGLNDWTE